MTGPVATGPEQIAHAIATALAKLPTLRPRWISAFPDRPSSQRATATRRPRLTIVVSGIRRVLARIDSDLRVHELHPGDVLIVPAQGWSLPMTAGNNRIIAINCHDYGTQFMSPLSLDPIRAMFLSSKPLNQVAWSLLAGLVHMRDQPALRVHADQLLRTTVAAALLDCRAWPQGDQALLTWSRARAFAGDHLDAGRIALARAAGVHPNHLSRLCRQMEGTSLMTWLTGLRMERVRLLLASGMTAQAAATACGYGDLSHFRRAFQRVHGVPPMRWQRQAVL